MNKDNKILNDKELEEVNGGENVGGICNFKDITMGDAAGELKPDEKGDKSTAYKVGIFPGLSGFP